MLHRRRHSQQSLHNFITFCQQLILIKQVRFLGFLQNLCVRLCYLIAAAAGTSLVFDSLPLPIHMVYGSHDSKRLPWPEHQSILQKIQHCYEYCSICAKNLFRTLPVTRSSPNRWRRGDIQNPHRSPVSESHRCLIALGVLAKCLLARPSCAERTSQFLSVFSQTYDALTHIFFVVFLKHVFHKHKFSISVF